MIEQAKALLDSLAITFDFPILEFIRNYLTNPFFDKVMPYITLFGEWGAFWIAVALILVLIPKTRKTGWSMGAAMLLGLIICNGILKTLIARDRPFFFYTVERMQQYTAQLPQLKCLYKGRLADLPQRKAMELGEAPTVVSVYLGLMLGLAKAGVHKIF
mgnify:CR=1 FL=1